MDLKEKNLTVSNDDGSREFNQENTHVYTVKSRQYGTSVHQGMLALIPEPTDCRRRMTFEHSCPKSPRITIG